MAEFFDSKQILHLVTGDRRPEEVYVDFSAVFHSIVDNLKENSVVMGGGGEDRILSLADRTVVWVVGGPGSKKYQRVGQILKEHPTWTLINTGSYLDIDPHPSHDQHAAREFVLGILRQDRSRLRC